MNKIKVKYGAVNIILKRVGAYPSCISPLDNKNTQHACIPSFFYINCFEFKRFALLNIVRRTLLDKDRVREGQTYEKVQRQSDT